MMSRDGKILTVFGCQTLIQCSSWCCRFLCKIVKDELVLNGFSMCLLYFTAPVFVDNYACVMFIDKNSCLNVAIYVPFVVKMRQYNYAMSIQ